MKCPNCGAKLKETDRKCPACGKSVPAAAKKPAGARSWLILGLALAVLLAAGVMLYPKLVKSYRSGKETQAASGPVQSAATDAPAPYHLDRDFTVTDGDGNQVRLSDFAGKPVVVNFWTTWCGYCVREFPEFQKAWETYGDRVAFLMVDLTDDTSETPRAAKAFIEQNGFRFPVYFDTLYEAQRTYSLSAIPVTMVLDASGRQVDYHIGAIDGETLTSLIQTALGAR